MEENILRISYQNGNFNLSLDAFLPCTQKEFKMVLEMVNQDQNMEAIVNQLYGYIVGQLEQDVFSVQYLRKFTSFDGYKKKMTALKDILEKNYTFLTIRPTEESEKKVTAKSAIVYIFTDGRMTDVKNVIGWRFEKAGYPFSIIKTDSGRYVVKLYGMNVNGQLYKSRAAAIDSIDDMLLAIFEKNADKLAYAKERYQAAMIEAGYMEPEEIKAEKPVIAIKPEVVKVPETKAETTEKRNRIIAYPGRPAYIRCFVVRSNGHVVRLKTPTESDPETSISAIQISGLRDICPVPGHVSIGSPRSAIHAYKETISPPIWERVKTIASPGDIRTMNSLWRGG